MPGEEELSIQLPPELQPQEEPAAVQELGMTATNADTDIQVEPSVTTPPTEHEVDSQALEMPVTESAPEKEIAKFDIVSPVRTDWAAVLKEHPVGQSFKDSHPAMTFNPEGMDLAEEAIVGRDQETERQKSYLEKIKIPLNSDLLSGMLEVFGKDADLNELISNPDTTIKQMQDRFIILQQGNIAQSAERASSLRDILETVRQGNTDS